MWDLRYLQRIDWRMVAVICALMLVSLLVISAHTPGLKLDVDDQPFLTPLVKTQLKWFGIGWVVYFICTAFDYNKLREWTWILYVLILFALFGLFFTSSIQSVHRWYRIPLIGISFQPSEQAKLIVVMTLAWFLERRTATAHTLGTALFSGIIVGIPFLLILKQPDLGSALVLFPVTLVMFYFGGVHPFVVRTLSILGLVILISGSLVLMGVIDHDGARPYFTKVLKDYQYERLNPETMHQRASATAIGVGGLTGTGWRKGDFSGKGWLPYPYTDSVFPAFGEEFGLFGLIFLLLLFYALLYFGFQVTALAKDHFGRLLSAGITIYLAMHILVNIGMMCGFLPITGVPLVLVTYGGSSVLVTMASLGILQSIYSRRFMF